MPESKKPEAAQDAARSKMSPTAVSEKENNRVFRLEISHIRRKFLERRVNELENTIFQNHQKFKKQRRIDSEKTRAEILRLKAQISELQAQVIALEAPLKKAKTLTEITLNLVTRLKKLFRSTTWKIFKPIISAFLSPRTLGTGANTLTDVQSILEQFDNWVDDSGVQTLTNVIPQTLHSAGISQEAAQQGPPQAFDAPNSADGLKGKNVLKLLRESVGTIRIGFAITESVETSGAGDFYTASELAAALKSQLGWDAVLLGENDTGRSWYDVRGLDCLIVLLEHYDLREIPEHLNNLVKIAWVRNWIDQWIATPWFSRYDMVLCTSEIARSYIQEQTGKSAQIFRIASNPERFYPGRPITEALQSDYCFTGNYWGVERQIERIVPQRIPYEFALYGKNWQRHAQFREYYRGALPYKQIPDVYASTKLLVDDANHVTLPWGSVNSRVFDALASGTLVLTNGRAGAKEIFGDQLPTYSSVPEFEEKVKFFLENPEERVRTAKALRERVIQDHTYEVRALQFRALLQKEAQAKARVAIKLPIPPSDDVCYWGDFHFASALARALRNLGYAVRLDLISDWYVNRAIADDVVITVRGLSRYQPQPCRLNLLWIISHPDEVEPEECDAYDHVFVASKPFARELNERTATEVSPLLQCTDTQRFNLNTQTRKNSAALFVGNTRNEYRPIVKHAIEAGLQPIIVGRGWQQFVDDSFIECEHLENNSLPQVYAACGVVLCDHWEDMKRRGFISNRIFDILACGGSVVTDEVTGIREVFDDLVHVYDGTPEGLAKTVRFVLANADTRSEEQLGKAMRVIEENSFDSRAAFLDRFITGKLQTQDQKR